LYAYGLLWNIYAMAASTGVWMSEPSACYLSQIILSFSNALVLHRWVKKFLQWFILKLVVLAALLILHVGKAQITCVFVKYFWP
jgi:hypothetical protein